VLLPISLQAPGPRQPNPDGSAPVPLFISCLISCLIGGFGASRSEKGCSRLAATRQGIPAIQFPGWKRVSKEGGPFLDPQRFWRTPPLIVRGLGQIGFRAGQPRSRQPFESVSRKRQACHPRLRQNEPPAGLRPKEMVLQMLRADRHH